MTFSVLAIVVEPLIVVVANVVLPVTVRVDVAVMFPAVKLEIVAFVVVELDTTRLVIVARTFDVRVSIVPKVVVRKEENRLVEVEVLDVVVPATVRVVADAWFTAN